MSSQCRDVTSTHTEDSKCKAVVFIHPLQRSHWAAVCTTVVTSDVIAGGEYRNEEEGGISDR